MLDLTVVNEQYRPKTPEEPPSDKFQRRFKRQVESTKELVEFLLAELDRGDSDEWERVKWYARSNYRTWKMQGSVRQVWLQLQK